MFILLTIGSFSVAITWMTLRHKRLMKAGGSVDMDALREELAHLREDSNAQIAELHERLDFTERLLAQQRDPAAPALPPRPPRITTPV
jgi:hypothetical protein